MKSVKAMKVKYICWYIVGYGTREGQLSCIYVMSFPQWLCFWQSIILKKYFASTFEDSVAEAECFRACHPSAVHCPFIFSLFSVCPLSINTYFVWRDISVLSGEISMKLATNIHHVSGNCWKGFQGQKSKVDAIMAEACFSTVSFRLSCLDTHSLIIVMLRYIDKNAEWCVRPAMYSFVLHCPELVTEDVTRRLLPSLECALTMTIQ